MKAKKLFMMLAVLMASVGMRSQTLETVVTIDGLRYMFNDGGSSSSAIFCGIADGYEFTDLEIPASVKYNDCECKVYRIERDALRRHTEIRSIRLPETISQISDDAFNGCSSLVDFNIPESVTLLGRDVFEGTAWLAHQAAGLVEKDHVVITWKGAAPTDGELWIEDGTRLIAKRAFYKKGGLHTVHIPASIQDIGNEAFLSCGLRELWLETPIVEGWFQELPITKVVLCEGVTTVKPRAFAHCSMLEEVVFPESIKDLHTAAFSGTKWLSALRYASNDIIYINNIAFSYGFKVPDGATLQLREGTRAIAGHAFGECKNVSSLEVPEGVELIGEGAFWCSNLTEIRLPATLKEMRKDALCAVKTVDIISDSTDPTDLSDDTFSDAFAKATTLTVPANTSSLYRQRKGWKRIANIVERSADGIQSPQKVNVIWPNGRCFDLSGRRLTAPPAKGVYIENGKKVAR